MVTKEILPDYRGTLASAAWSRLRATKELRHALKKAALRSRKACLGRGFLGAGRKVEACYCVNRRGEATP